jgi:pimeloyl-ACP methyl ester carboxylesterase
MLTQYAGFPTFEVMYDTGGHLVDPTVESEMTTYFGAGAGVGVTDVIVISHGWNNDIADARALYFNFFASFAQTLPQSQLHGQERSFGIVAIFWPSKRFADADLISGGAAALASPVDARLSAQLASFTDLFSSDPAASQKVRHLQSLLPTLETDPAAQDDYVATLVSMVPQPRYEVDEGLDAARTFLNTASGHEVLQRLSTPFIPVAPRVPPSAGVGGAASLAPPIPGTGAAAGWLTDLAGGIKAAAANLGNVMTYYTMKDRAGVVGRTGAAETVGKLRDARLLLNIHLVGHSFGGRLVTAVANQMASAGKSLQSMALLEAAYSHNGLAKNWDGQGTDGAFRQVITARSVAGNILITHSAHDFPVGTAYPIASRIMNQAASALVGGPNDVYGGMGRNGAQHTPEAIDDTLHAIGAGYAPLPAGQWIRNLNGDGPLPAPTIESHGDVAKPEITWALQEHI